MQSSQLSSSRLLANEEESIYGLLVNIELCAFFQLKPGMLKVVDNGLRIKLRTAVLSILCMLSLLVSHDTYSSTCAIYSYYQYRDKALLKDSFDRSELVLMGDVVSEYKLPMPSVSSIPGYSALTEEHVESLKELAESLSILFPAIAFRHTKIWKGSPSTEDLIITWGNSKIPRFSCEGQWVVGKSYIVFASYNEDGELAPVSGTTHILLGTEYRFDERLMQRLDEFANETPLFLQE
jgi:hypothetical protein